VTKLLVIREYLKHFYSKYEIYLRPVWKLVLAFVTLLTINGRLGYMSRIDDVMIVLIVALMCSFLPTGCIAVFAALFILLHLYALSMESALVMLLVFVVMFLLYFRFTPKSSIVLLLTPLAFGWKIPYVMPLAMGLIGTPAAVLSVGCGAVIYFFLSFINDNVQAINVMEDDITTKFRFFIDGLINNKEMIVTIATFAAALIVVYLIRRMSVDYSSTIAMIAGTLVNIVMLLVGDLMYDTNVSILGILAGSIVSIILVKILEFFVFSVDYSRTERVQFEDDEYYYYVKAVPKLSVATPTKTVKKINTQKSQNVPTKTVSRTVNTVNSSARSTAGAAHTTGTTHTGASRTVGTAHRPEGAVRPETGARQQGTARTVNTVNTAAGRSSSHGSERSSIRRD